MRKTILIIFAAVCLFVSVVFLLFNFMFYPKNYQNFIEKYSREFGVETSLVYAIVKAESGFDSKAVSRAGAKGLMQILPTTAEWIAGKFEESFSEEILFNPETNIKYGCFYLRYLIDKFSDLDAVICAYNAGERTVKYWLNDEGGLDESKITYSETKNYLKKVKKYKRYYSMM